MKKPNIIFIMADQLAAQSVGCYGSGVNSTPTIDYLANKGVRFDRSYANWPVCAPNRATILTGRSAQIHGITRNNLVFNADLPTYPEVLKEAGYNTGGFGKFHLSPMSQPVHENLTHIGFNESIITEDPKLGPWLDWIEKEYPKYFKTALSTCWPMEYLHHYGNDKRNIMPLWEEAYEGILMPIQEEYGWHMMYTSPLPKELHQTTYITDISLDFIKKHSKSNRNEPFFCYISYVDPHDPYDPPKPYDTMFDPKDMPEAIPNTWKNNHSKTLESSRNWHNCRRLDGDHEKIAKLRALYHGSIKFIDDQVKRIVDYLTEADMWNNTILVFTTDHGDMIGDQGLMTKGAMHYDKSIRTPLIVSGSNIEQGKATNRLTSSLDFFPTLLNWANVKELPLSEGKAFNLITDMNRSNVGNMRINKKSIPKTKTYNKWMGIGWDFEETTIVKDTTKEGDDDKWDVVTVETDTTRSIISDDGFRLTIFDEDHQGQMFDLKNDPEEMKNLYYELAFTKKKEELFEKMQRAYMRPLKIQQYRNMPIGDKGEKYCVKNFELIPVYTKKE